MIFSKKALWSCLFQLSKISHFLSHKITGGITEISFARSNALLASSALAQNPLNNGWFHH